MIRRLACSRVAFLVGSLPTALAFGLFVADVDLHVALAGFLVATGLYMILETAWLFYIS